MPRTVAKFRRFGDWVEFKKIDTEDRHGNAHTIVIETVEVVHVCTGVVTPRGRWRVRVETEAKYRPRTRSFSGGDIGQQMAEARAQEILDSFTKTPARKSSRNN